MNKDLLATCTSRESASGEVRQRGRMRGRARRTASARTIGRGRAREALGNETLRDHTLLILHVYICLHIYKNMHIQVYAGNEIHHVDLVNGHFTVNVQLGLPILNVC